MNENDLRVLEIFGRMKLLVRATRVTLIMYFKDFINVTLLFDDHKFQAYKVILAVSIAAAFPRRRGISAFHRFIERGYLPQQWSLETNRKAEALTISIQP